MATATVERIDSAFARGSAPNPGIFGGMARINEVLQLADSCVGATVNLSVVQITKGAIPNYDSKHGVNKGSPNEIDRRAS